MAELVTEVFDSLGYEEADGAVLMLVPEVADELGEERPPKLTAEESAFLLARGPYIGRLTAQQTLLAFAERAALSTGEQGPTLPEYVIDDVKQNLVRRQRELADFEASWAYVPVTDDEIVAGALSFMDAAEDIYRDLDEEVPAEEPRLPETRRKVQTTTPRTRSQTAKTTACHRTPPPANLASAGRSKPRSRPILSVLGAGDDELVWQERALCTTADPEAFFPEKGGSTKEAKRVCLSCEVRVECLEYALNRDERFGVWGGLTERERRKLKKRTV